MKKKYAGNSTLEQVNFEKKVNVNKIWNIIDF